ncbi:MAG: hypothetical protein HW419_3010, partial [Deltaproteobacteria bacterium]|nr:hypothetical protein [Deltaproteobacteria bacterium]
MSTIVLLCAQVMVSENVNEPGQHEVK